MVRIVFVGKWLGFSGRLEIKMEVCTFLLFFFHFYFWYVIFFLLVCFSVCICFVYVGLFVRFHCATLPSKIKYVSRYKRLDDN